MHRALRPGGEALVEDLRRDVSLSEIDSYLKQSGRSRFDAWMTKWAPWCMLIKRAYTKEQFLRMAQGSRFGACEIKLASIGFEVQFTKPAHRAVSVM